MIKTNSTFKLAGILLALVLVTSCFVGSTFAKYVTSETGTDSARVAKFGVTITANGTTFADTYATDDANVVAAIANSVVSTEKVIAPGTKGDMVSATITGTPEVAVEVKYEATVELGDNWKDSTGAYYCPLEITITGDGEPVTLKGTDYESADAFEAAIKEKIDEYKKNYAAGTDLSAVETVKPIAVSWAWAFEGNDDVKDTYLGDQAAAGSAATISLEIKTTVTQID